MRISLGISMSAVSHPLEFLSIWKRQWIFLLRWRWLRLMSDHKSLNTIFYGWLSSLAACHFLHFLFSLIFVRCVFMAPRPWGELGKKQEWGWREPSLCFKLLLAEGAPSSSFRNIPHLTLISHTTWAYSPLSFTIFDGNIWERNSSICWN